MKTYQLLIPNYRAVQLIETWMAAELSCDLRLRRAKTKGCTVIETTDVAMAENIRQWYECQGVRIRE